jgi:hypothetical protein
VSDDGDAAYQCWAIVERVGIQIGELPMKARKTAFADAEHFLRTAGNAQGLTGQRLDMFVDLQMRAVRQIVTELDVRKVPRVEVKPLIKSQHRRLDGTGAERRTLRIARTISMSVPDYPKRLRELAEQCKKAARGSFEIETKGTFRTVAADLSKMADELEQRAGLGGAHWGTQGTRFGS